jgi:hypothetical protein
MINATRAEAAPHGGGAGKSLKERNRWQLWIIVAANSLFLYGVAQANAIKAEGLRAALTDAQNLVPVGFALVLATVLNGLLSADAKARLVFLRWLHALPGHRAFSKYAVRDPRIDPSALEKVHGGPLPTDPPEQNRAWYRIYKSVENDHAVRQVHQDFLLLRDYTGLSVLFVLFYGAAGLYAIPSVKVALIYVLTLALQYVLVRQAASNYGVRMVTTVLARRGAKETPDIQKTSRKRTPAKPRRNDAKEPLNAGETGTQRLQERPCSSDEDAAVNASQTDGSLTVSNTVDQVVKRAGK